MKDRYFFCGIGGSGMSALAAILKQKGHEVSGSDRGRDNGDSPEKFTLLERQGIKLFPQDGSGIDDNIDILVVSSAVEDSIPDVRAALVRDIPVRKRAEVLAGLFNGMRGIAVGGTSGKTTVTGMVGHILLEAGRTPTVMNGGQVVSFLEKGLSGNALVGTGELFVAETDESDGSIALFMPDIAVLNNITLDHKPLDELRPLFAGFVSKTKSAAVINLDDPEAAELAHLNKNTVTFAIEHPQARFCAENLSPQPTGMHFMLRDHESGEVAEVNLQVPGRHNVLNALAAIAACCAAGIPLSQAAGFIGSFKGIKRRFEIVGKANDVTVIDDFGHNPDKIAATLQTLCETPGRIIAVFQPHGFGPTRMLKDGLIETFCRYLSGDDLLVMPEIYYAGGTAQKTISAGDIIDAVAAAGKQAAFFERRADIPDFILQQAKPGDRVVVMGARDDTLSDFARSILDGLKRRAA